MMKYDKSSSYAIGLFKFLLLVVMSGPTQAHNKVVVIPMAGDAQSLGNVVTVAKKNGDFNDPIAANNSIKNASENNPYLIVIGPGVYSLSGQLLMQEWVSIAGSGQQITTLTGTLNGSDNEQSSMVVGASNVSLTDLSIENIDGSGTALGLYNEGSSVIVERLAIDVGTGGNAFGLYSSGSPADFSDINVAVFGSSIALGVAFQNSEPTMTNAKIVASSQGTTYGIQNANSSTRLNNVDVIVLGGNTSAGMLEIQNSSSTLTNITIDATTAFATAGNISMGIWAFGSSPKLNGVTATARGGEKSYGLNLQDGSPSKRERINAKPSANKR